MALHPALNIADFTTLCEQQTQPADYPHAQSVQQNILCYAGDTLRQAERDDALRQILMQEISHALLHGPGVLMVTETYPNLSIIEQQNAVFDTILKQETDRENGDHFAKAGTNSRIWNALQKSALIDPQGFIDYYKNPILTLLSEAWLGPNFQMTAQVNIVHPSGQAQSPHRDYHLGFQSPHILTQYPPHVHPMSAMLTLQGAVAHTDMPLESGPTLFLPYSQQYAEGYRAGCEPAFMDYFGQHKVQLPLKQGDTAFFNPALFHAAGSNHTADFHRSANVLQISSAFGRAMESVDRYAISRVIYPHLRQDSQNLSAAELGALLGSACEGYAFPTNLDTDPPLGGLAPETLRELTERALKENWQQKKYEAELLAHQRRRSAV